MSLEGPIRTLLVDDEDLARDRMRTMLEPFDDIDVVGEARNGDEALEAARIHRPELIFLDIDMPGKSGLEVVSALEPPRPCVVYCTAFDQYAVEAFELNAVDYLLKPVTRVRLERSINKVTAQISERKLFRREVELAEAAQHRLFPRSLPELSHLNYTGVCRPVRWVSGDYYDFLPLGNGKLGLVIADVSGKGMAAGLLMAGLQGRLKSESVHYGNSLVELVQGLNLSMCEATDDSRFVTFFYGVFDDTERTLSYVNAGHNPPILLERDGSTHGRIVRLETGGMVLGVLPDASYTQGSVQVRPGDLLVLFTDGVTEIMDLEGSEFGEERLIDLVRDRRELPLAALTESVLSETERYRGSRALEDDFTLVLARGC